jgi:hypothetical protein
MNRFKFFENEGLKQINKVEEQVAPQPNEYSKSSILFKENEAKYRSEQLVVIKIDGIIENHAETKLEYKVKKMVVNGQLMAKVDLVDQVLNIQPSYLQESMTLMGKIDVIKSNALVVIEPANGKVKGIANIDEIKNNWLAFKNDIYAGTSFVQSPEIKANIETFVKNVDTQMNEESIMLDFQVRPFFDLFFDSYLVDKAYTFNNYTKLYYSQLFDHLPVEFDVTQTLIDEQPNLLTINKQARLNSNNMHLADFEKIYDLKYKPRIGYKFSNYDFEHQTQVSYNLNENLLSDASMGISETVKNNIELIVDYTVRRIE